MTAPRSSERAAGLETSAEVPEYCRATHADAVPSLACPVSSMTHACGSITPIANRATPRLCRNELLAGLNIAVENQVLSGDGLGANVLGILRTSGILTQAAVGTDLFATTRSAVTSLEALGHAPSVWVFSGRLAALRSRAEHQRPVRSA